MTDDLVLFLCREDRCLAGGSKGYEVVHAIGNDMFNNIGEGPEVNGIILLKGCDQGYAGAGKIRFFHNIFHCLNKYRQFQRIGSSVGWCG